MPAALPDRLQLGGQGLIGEQIRRQGLQLQRRIRIQAAQQSLQQLRRDALLAQPRQHRRIEAEHLSLPVVVHHLGGAFTVIAVQFRCRPQPSLQGMALQGAMAEAMNGGDIGAIQTFQGQQ